MTLGARGVSILFAAGDGGVSGLFGMCSLFFPSILLTAHLSGGDCANFVPTFPSTCPFVTSVGATTGIAPEVAAILSSGTVGLPSCEQLLTCH